MKTITVTGTGLSGKEWIKRLEKKKYRIGTYARQLLDSPEYEKHRLKKGKKIEVQLVSVKDMGKSVATTKEIQEYAASKGLEMPSAELALLIREAVSDTEMEAMGVWYIASLHEPIKDSDGNPSVLSVNRFDEGRWLYAYWGEPGDDWGDGGAFGFPLPASKSSALGSSALNLDTESLEARVKALEDFEKQVRSILVLP